MKEVGARHIIVVSAGGIYEELPEPFNAWDKGMVGQYRPIHRKTADVAEQSGLSYTVLRPVWLTNKPTEVFQLTRKGETFTGTETSRASMAPLCGGHCQERALRRSEPGYQPTRFRW